MGHQAGFRWGGRRGGNSLVAREHAAPVWSERAGLFLSCFLRICIVVVPVPSVCCSVKLPLSRPTGFCLFLFILLRTPAGGGAAAWRFCCWRQPKPRQQLPQDAAVKAVLSERWFSGIAAYLEGWVMWFNRRCLQLRSQQRPVLSSHRYSS